MLAPAACWFLGVVFLPLAIHADLSGEDRDSLSPETDKPAPEAVAALDPDQQMRADLARSHWERALTLKESGDSVGYRRALEQVLEHDPDHSPARAALGFVERNGQWLTRDEMREAQGMVRYKGRWVLPQERDIEEQKILDQRQQQEYFRKIRLWQRWLAGPNPERSAEARTQLLALRDPVAVRPLMEVLGGGGRSGSNRRVTTLQDRSILIESLSGISGDIATAALLARGLDEDEFPIRSQIAAELRNRRSNDLVGELAKVLRDPNNQRIRRAAFLLGELEDQAAIPVLVDAIVTEHRVESIGGVAAPLPIGTGIKYRPVVTEVLPDGTMIRRRNIPNRALQGQGLAIPGEAPSPVQRVENREVVDALVKLTGQDFGYDTQRWQAWLEKETRREAAGK